ncbi:MAG TPA: RecX family transcriptional regulator [Algoriphagus sp.]|jgi:regulatory protein|uniref:regulatory protein RecX n=1 Tax=Algoriphagus TaxID=246875 RepID=UPI000C3D8AB2|nr:MULTISPECIES: regulatory protein RecX [Algoriphagus]MAL15980.1 RecX family transcriptional regulator [Algoriphagus sp.]MAN89043.1 RecX family transcriptional regulator [Algoriphagus sp.]QYH40601.1 RecX family transcriptional regulator [Algoriphagus sp. NBT04N3]HAH37747.1 RecX family transcriptional regulator [Algoriphagus sp.]HAS59496.1 RecX family transcriptional regulator [Algoriphagus sp.]|tara:strand:- start:21 stop:521 length:501 start_codon:yes stop_codon:yes gene_type:complete
MSGWGKNNLNQSGKKSWTFTEAQEKLSTYCAYQERCSWEVRRKLFEKGITDERAEELISYLVKENFLDEERFARAFCRGKFRLKRWGKNRIKMELKMRQIPEELIRKGLLEIDPEEYYDTLLTETEKKWAKTNESDPYKKRYKVIGYLMQKGFEQDLIQEALESLK